MPQALLQAMAVGLPVIACPIGGIPESLNHYTHGTLTEEKNSAALCETMKHQITKESNGRLPRVRHTPFTLESLFQTTLGVYTQATLKAN